MISRYHVGDTIVLANPGSSDTKHQIVRIERFGDNFGRGRRLHVDGGRPPINVRDEVVFATPFESEALDETGMKWSGAFGLFLSKYARRTGDYYQLSWPAEFTIERADPVCLTWIGARTLSTARQALRVPAVQVFRLTASVGTRIRGEWAYDPDKLDPELVPYRAAAFEENGEAP